MPCPSALDPLLADARCPNIQGVIVRLGMEWLHACDYPEAPETRNVGCRSVFNVLDPMPGIVCAVHLAGVLIRVKCKTNRPISDGVSTNLNVSAIEFGHEALIAFGIP